MAKDNQRSFRYSGEVAAILENYKGDNLNQKFENLILHCFWEQPNIDKKIKEREKRLSELNEQISRKQQELFNLNQMAMYSHNMQAAYGDLMAKIRKISSEIDKM